MRARDIMSSPAVSVRPSTPVKTAERLLADRGFTALPVVDGEDRLVGIVTEGDFVAERFAESGHERGRRVADVMTADVIGVRPDTAIPEVARVMMAARIRAVPVVDRGRCAGVLTRRDLVGVLARPDALLERDIRDRLAVFAAPDRMRVEVHDGQALITDQLDSPRDRTLAVLLAEGVPGVVEARCRVAERT